MPLLLSQPDGVGRIIPSPGGASWFAWQVWMKIGGNWLNKVAFLVADFIFECREFLSVVRLKCVFSVSSCMDLTVFGFIAILGDFYSLVFFFFQLFAFCLGVLLSFLETQRQLAVSYFSAWNYRLLEPLPFYKCKLYATKFKMNCFWTHKIECVTGWFRI